MNAPETVSIINRFFLALDDLKAMGIIRGKKTFTDRYGIDRWNLNKLQKEPEKWPFDSAWIVYLCGDFGVSPKWLILGVGKRFDRNPESPDLKRVRRVYEVNKKVNNDN